MIDEYRKCSKICASLDCSDNKSVQKNNRAVSRMYKIVQTAAAEGLEAIGRLSVLLDEPESGKWIAHQLVEKADLPKEVEDKCFRIIEILSKGDSLNALGNSMWLDEWKKKKGRV